VTGRGHEVHSTSCWPVSLRGGNRDGVSPISSFARSLTASLESAVSLYARVIVSDPRSRVKRNVTEGVIPESPGKSPQRTQRAQREKRSPRRHKGRKPSRRVPPSCLGVLVVDPIRNPKPAMRNANSPRDFYAYMKGSKRKGETTRLTCPCGAPAEDPSAPMRLLCNLLHCVYKFFTRKRRRKCLTVLFVDLYHVLNDLT